MQAIGAGDDDDPSTALNYWLNWKVFQCAVCVISPMAVAAFLIWKYEHSTRRESRQPRASPRDASWKPCLSFIRPGFLLSYRIFAFSLLLIAISFDLAIHGIELFMYYTQWAFTLVTVYFALGALLSFRGCFYGVKMTDSAESSMPDDVERGMYVPIAAGRVDDNGAKLFESSEKSYPLLFYSFCDDLFHVLYQMTAGAVMITDVVYWIVIFPFMSLRDYEMNFLTVVTHALNIVLLLGDAVLNRLQFPWYGISYFVVLTGFYVIFQWIIHACISIWWPYPFMDLSEIHATLWYVIVAVMHIPCYYIFMGLVEVKQRTLSRYFPGSYVQ